MLGKASIIFVLSLVNLVCGQVDLNLYKLDQLQVIFRHGDRTPGEAEILENDPYDDIYKSYGYGELTTVGKQREHRIGQVLRNRYDAFLGEYRRQDVFAYSTQMDRTKMSLQLLLAGLYPPTPSTTWNYYINWQPIPTNYDLWDYGFLSAAITCPTFGKIFKDGVKKLNDALSPQDQSFLRYLEEATGIKVTELSTTWVIYNNFRSALSLGLPLPKGFGMDSFYKLEGVMIKILNLLSSTDDTRRIMTGPVVERLLQVLKDDKDQKKIYLYGGHEFNIAAFLGAHNISGIPATPDYGSTLIFERLRGPDGRKYMRVLLWTGVSEQLITLKVNNCGELCPLSEYEKIVQPILPNEESSKACSPKAACKRRMGPVEHVDMDSHLAYLFAGSDLKSFKYMKDFLPLEIERS